MEEHQVVQHQQARDARQQVVGKGVVAGVAHLVDDGVVGSCAVAGQELGGGMRRDAAGQPSEIDALLRVEEVDLVCGREQGDQLSRVVGDPGRRRRQRRDAGQPHVRAEGA
jgi:hypothetical protein